MSVKNKVVEWLIRRELKKHVEGGTMIGKIWTWFDGKKTVIGSVVYILGEVANQLAVVLPDLLGPSEATKYVGIAVAVVGGLHKAYKFIYKTDAPSK